MAVDDAVADRMFRIPGRRMLTSEDYLRAAGKKGVREWVPAHVGGRQSGPVTPHEAAEGHDA